MFAMTHFRAVILDVDGTLVDSNDAHARSWQEALSEHGYDVPFKRIRNLIGMGGDNLLPEAIHVEKDSELGQQIAKRRQEIFKSRYLPELKAFPEVRALVARLRDAGLKVVVASSGEKDEVEHLLELAQVTDLVEAQTSSADAENSKPDPDIIEAALEKLDYPPYQVVMLGDTPYDVEAASKAGVPVIAMRSGEFSDDDLKDAIAIYDDAADLLHHFNSSPLVK
jgi:HAD superfamily hydrolase (TIGR01549 family)